MTMPKFAPRIRYHNRVKVFLCYVLAWGLALLLPYLALKYLYPYKLAGAAPELLTALTGLNLPLPQAALDALNASAVTQSMGQAALQTALHARDLVWRYTVGGVVAAAWVLSLAWQLVWRAFYLRPRQGARAALRAVHTYRWSLAGIAGLNLLGALVVYGVGLRLVAGRTLWDYAICFCGFLLIPLAATVCFRLGAPPAISGKKAYFRRL